MMPKAHIVTYGCQMNRQESGVMSALLSRAGYVLTDEIDEASLVVVETCAIRKKAEEKVYSLLGRLRKRRESSPSDLTIALCGCVATREAAEDLVARHGVSVVLGPRRVARIAEAVRASREAPVVDIGDEWAVPPDDVSAPDVPGVSAFVTVMQGCSNACTYCVVPSRRGPAESRPAGEIVAEVRRLADAGYGEVTLLGQNISHYGIDRPGTERLIDLLARVETETAMPRIRFATSHPAYIDDRFIDGFGRLSRVMPHLHLPAQSGSDRILAAMRRGYTAERYLEIVRAIRASRPGTSVMTDIITGFDGETPEDHAATLAFLRAGEFDGAFIFPYSERPGTAAATAAPGPKVPHAERKRRCHEALKLVEEIAAPKRERQRGSIVEVLVEEPGRGRELGNITVCFEGGRPGLILKVLVGRTSAFALKGEVVA